MARPTREYGQDVRARRQVMNDFQHRGAFIAGASLSRQNRYRAQVAGALARSQIRHAV